MVEKDCPLQAAGAPVPLVLEVEAVELLTVPTAHENLERLRARSSRAVFRLVCHRWPSSANSESGPVHLVKKLGDSAAVGFQQQILQGSACLEVGGSCFPEQEHGHLCRRGQRLVFELEGSTGEGGADSMLEAAGEDSCFVAVVGLQRMHEQEHFSS